MSGLFLLLFFVILFVVGTVVTALVSRSSWISSRLKRGLVVLTWVGLWMIPFWDLIPGKLYLTYISQDAGTSILSTEFNPVDLRHAISAGSYRYETEKLPFHTTRVDKVYLDPVTKARLVRVRSYKQWGDNDAFIKPWMSQTVHSEAGLSQFKQLQKD